MKQEDLFNEIATKTGSTKAEVKRVLDGLGVVAHSRLKSGEEIPLPGIGKLTVSTRAARNGRNPRTGETLSIAAKSVPKFTAFKGLKDAVAS